MKKIILLAFVTILGLTSCEKEEIGYRLNNTQLEMKVGERYQLVLTKEGVTQKVQYFRWRSSDVNVGDVNGSAQAYAKKKGNFTVEVLERGTLAPVGKCEITVID